MGILLFACVQSAIVAIQPMGSSCALAECAAIGADEGHAPACVVPAEVEHVSVQAWLVAGPLPSPEFAEVPAAGPYREGFAKDLLAALGGEAEACPRAGDVVLKEDGQTIAFEAHQWDDAYINLIERFGQLRNVCAYLYSELESPVEQTVYLHVGTNDCGQVWLNGERVVCHADDRPAAPSQNVAKVALRPGRNRLLMKIGQAGAGWGAFVEIYGSASHERFVLDNFPRHLELLSRNPAPDPGETVRIHVANWLPREKETAVAWRVTDDQGERVLAGTGPAIEVVVPDGGPQVVRVDAECEHPRGGVVGGGCTLLVKGEAVLAGALARFERHADSIGDPFALDGAQRDAYVLALYAVERHERNNAPDSPYRNDAHERSETVGRLVSALDHLEAGRDPFDGRTGRFEAAYLSEADGTAQPFMLYVPQDYAPDRRYALMVYLHGAGKTHEFIPWSHGCAADAAYASELITVAIMGRGVFNGYTGLGECDVLEVMDWVTARYPIDEDRIYIQGDSMGGGGTWHIAGKYADRFAAAMVNCGWPSFDQLPNFLALPTYVNHGTVDWDVPVAWARLGVSVMRRWEAPVVFNEYEGIPHSVSTVVQPLGYMTRLGAHRRETQPPHIRICAAHPRHGSLYWGRIATWDDPHERAMLEARVLPDNVVNVDLTNATAATLTPPAEYVDLEEPITWFVNATRVVTEPGLRNRFDVLITEDGPEVREHIEIEPRGMRAYAPGSLMELYRGEPLLIVYGTQSREERLNTAIREMAEALSHRSMPEDRMEFGHIPTVPDTGLTPEREATRNLFLLGGPGENAVTARLMKQLPIRENRRRLHVFDTKPVSLAGRGYGFLHPNPEHPERLVFVYASQEPGYYRLAEGWESPGASAIVNRAWWDPDIPDVFVEAVREDAVAGIVRCGFLTHGWQPAPTQEARELRQPASLAEFAAMKAELLRTATGATYAIVEQANAEEPCPYMADAPCWETIRWLAPCKQMISFEITGAELTEFAEALKEVDHQLLPGPTPSEETSDAGCRVAATPDIIWALGEQEMVPRGVRLHEDRARLQEAAKSVWRGNMRR